MRLGKLFELRLRRRLGARLSEPDFYPIRIEVGAVLCQNVLFSFRSARPGFDLVFSVRTAHRS
jgi:hypothetical protein